MAKYDAQKSDGDAQALGQWHQADDFPAPVMDGFLQGARNCTASLGRPTQFQEGLRFADDLTTTRDLVVPGRRSRLRQTSWRGIARA